MSRLRSVLLAASLLLPGAARSAAAQAAVPRTWLGAGVGVQPDKWLGIFLTGAHETSSIAVEARFFTSEWQGIEVSPETSREIALLVGPRRRGHRVLWGIAAGVSAVKGKRVLNQNTWAVRTEPYEVIGAALEAQVIVRFSDGFGLGVHGIGDINTARPWAGLAFTLVGGLPERGDQ